MLNRVFVLPDYRLTTAKILYHMPDHPGLLQTFIWQHMDSAPDYPVLHRFIDYWKRNLDGPLHSVVVGNRRLVGPEDFNHANASYAYH